MQRTVRLALAAAFLLSRAPQMQMQQHQQWQSSNIAAATSQQQHRSSSSSNSKGISRNSHLLLARFYFRFVTVEGWAGVELLRGRKRIPIRVEWFVWLLHFLERCLCCCRCTFAVVGFSTIAFVFAFCSEVTADAAALTPPSPPPLEIRILTVGGVAAASVSRKQLSVAVDLRMLTTLR